MVTSEVTVPFLDLGAVHHVMTDTLLADLRDLIEAGTFINGRQVAEFEDAFAAYCGTFHAVGVASGLDAMRLALIAADLEPGDEVVVPANTFVATLEAVTQAGGTPVPVDVSEQDYNVDVTAADAAVGPRTRFLVPVDLYGQLANMRELARLADRHGLVIVEDACQAHGATRDGVRAGATGLAGCFSFYPGKNLGAMGDAGALVTGDGELATTVRSLREHGQTRKYRHERIGWTARLDTLQAIVLLHKLPLLDSWNEERGKAARYYSAELAGVGDLRLPQVALGSRPVWHLYVVRTSDPERLSSFLAERRIGTGRHYPEPPHLSPAYEYLGYAPGSFPVTEALARECLSLPIFPGITEEQLSAVVVAVGDYFRRG